MSTQWVPSDGRVSIGHETVARLAIGRRLRAARPGDTAASALTPSG